MYAGACVQCVCASICPTTTCASLAARRHTRRTTIWSDLRYTRVSQSADYQAASGSLCHEEEDRSPTARAITRPNGSEPVTRTVEIALNTASHASSRLNRGPARSSELCADGRLVSLILHFNCIPCGSVRVVRGNGDTLDRRAFLSTVMGDELPILKGILNGVVNYHNARRCPIGLFRLPLTIPQ